MRSFAKKVIQWFNEGNCCQISPTTKELLFALIPSSKETKIINKFNYTTLAICNITYIRTKWITREFAWTNLSINERPRGLNAAVIFKFAVIIIGLCAKSGTQ